MGRSGKTDKSNYVFVLLKCTSTALDDLKTILCDKKILADKDKINFYSPYYEVFDYYTNKTSGKELWGVGFYKSKLDQWVKDKGLTLTTALVENIQCISVSTNVVDLNYFVDEEGHFYYFLVVPNDKAMKELCFGKKKEGYNYYEWRCKGLNNMNCVDKTDKGIYNYLNMNHRFDARNRIEIEEKDLRQSYQLIESFGGLKLL